MKLKAAILATLIILGIILSLYVYWGIVEQKTLSAILFLIAFLITAMFSAKIMAEFRQLNKYVRARNIIRAILLPLTEDKKHAAVLAENLVLRRTNLEDWPEIPKNKSREISLILSRIAGSDKKSRRVRLDGQKN